MLIKTRASEEVECRQDQPKPYDTATPTNHEHQFHCPVCGIGWCRNG